MWTTADVVVQLSGGEQIGVSGGLFAGTNSMNRVSGPSSTRGTEVTTLHRQRRPSVGLAYARNVFSRQAVLSRRSALIGESPETRSFHAARQPRWTRTSTGSCG